MTWRNSVCMSMGRVACPDVNSMVLGVTGTRSSAIDDFYASTNTALTRIDPNFLATYGDEIAGLIFVGIISSTENYFRDILGFILTICPVAQAHSADEKVQLGSLLWAEGSLQNRSAFEFHAFSSAENIKRAIYNFTSYQVRPNGTFSLMLPEYDKLCELRHAVVHSAHLVAGKNAIKLGLRRTVSPLKVRLGYSELQAAGSVCTALVQSANNELFEALVLKWATAWRQRPSWEPADELRLIKKIRAAFLSRRDGTNGTITNAKSINQFIAQVRAEYNI
jgi:hypothetical protein